MAEVFRYMREHLWEDEPYAFVHPWTNRNVMIGHASIALEIIDDCPQVESVFVPVGGGGLMGGVGTARKRFNIRFYIIAIVFLMFDVDVIFIFPWATAFRLLVFGDQHVLYTPIGPNALGEMFLFLGILLIGWAYAYRKGALEWV